MTESYNELSYGSHSCAKTGEQETGSDASTGPTKVTVFGCEPPVSARGGSSSATGDLSFFYDPDEAQANCFDLSGEAHSKNHDSDDFHENQRKKRKVGSSPKSDSENKNERKNPRRNGARSKAPKTSNMDLPDQRAFKTWSRWLVLEAENPAEPLHQGLQIFAIEMGFAEISTSITNIRQIKPGVYLFECPDARVSQIALNRNGKIFVDRKIKVTPHKSLNTSRGVIRQEELNWTSIEQLEEGLKPQGVTKVQRVSRKKGETTVQTHTYFLTFSKPSPPEYIKILSQNMKVTPFVQKPLQCFKCQKFGHPKDKCKGREICRKCGHESHENACTQAQICTNCKGDHAPNFRQCPAYKKEAHILKIRSEKKCSFAAAKKEVEGLYPEKSYAQVVSGKQVPRKAVSSIGIQSEKVQSRSGTVQFPPELPLPEAIHAEALFLARELRASLKEKSQTSLKKKDASMQFETDKGGPAPKPSRQPRACRSAERTPRSVKPPRSKPGGATEQTPKPAQDTPVSAPQATGGEQAKEPAPTPNPPDIQMEVPSSPTPQTAEGGQAPQPASKEVEMVEMAASSKSPTKGEGEKLPGSVPETPPIPFDEKVKKSGTKGGFVHGSNIPKRKWSRDRHRPGRSRSIESERGVVCFNRFSPFEDPEPPPEVD